MKKKQQKQIKAFLIEEFGKDRGSVLFDEQEKVLNTIIKNTKNKSKNQMKTLINTILPRIALYKVLSKSGFTEDVVYKHMRKYMLDIVAAKKHSSTAKMELIPGFYALYSNITLKIMRKTDLQENGCAELCRLFCDVDNVTYGGLKKIGFTRTKPLGYGGDCCDFHFFKK